MHVCLWVRVRSAWVVSTCTCTCVFGPLFGLTSKRISAPPRNVRAHAQRVCGARHDTNCALELTTGTDMKCRSGFAGRRRQWSTNVGFGLLTFAMFYLNFQFNPWTDKYETYEFVVGLFDLPYNIFFSGADADTLARPTRRDDGEVASLLASLDLTQYDTHTHAKTNAPTEMQAR